jgi:prepilin signal peptidase PulO-like enzyme (type II secretory pathway)
VSDGWPIVAGIVGLFLGSITWAAAMAQVGLAGTGRQPDEMPLSLPRWLPLWGFGLDRPAATSERSRPPIRAGFEVAVAAYAAIVAFRADSAGDVVALLLFSIPLLVVLLVDWWTRVIFTNWIAAGIVLALVVAAVDGVRSVLEALGGLAIGAAVFGAFYILALVLYRDVRVVSLGAGDVWLAAMIGAMTGDVLAAIGTLFYGILLAAIGAGVLLLVRRGVQARALPSGSYLCAGALIGLALQVW